ncbi:MAG: hypothetical protein ABJC07_06675 [Acidobacteriota bacterium]
MMQSTWHVLSVVSTIPWIPPAEWATVPPHPGLTVFAFVAAVAGFFAAAGAFALCLALGWRTAARRIALAAATGAFFYLAILVAAGAASRERTLPPGGKKYFCEIDCHLAYSVVAGEPSEAMRPCGPPGGGLRVVHVETWFDPTTISSFRGNAPLSPNPRRVYLLDSRGRRYEPAADAGAGCVEAFRGSTPFTRPLRPGESYRTALGFRVPRGAGALRLWLGDPEPGIEQFVPGHENGVFHPRVYLALR